MQVLERLAAAVVGVLLAIAILMVCSYTLYTFYLNIRYDICMMAKKRQQVSYLKADKFCKEEVYGN